MRGEALAMSEKFVIDQQSKHWPSQVPYDISIPKIYGLGNYELLQKACISIVGARRGTPYGRAVASMVSRISAQMGIVVVSGGAIGVDSAATQAALAVQSSPIVVLGSGADIFYPKRNEAMFRSVLAKDGAIISIAPFGTEPQRWAFPRRNVLIAALSNVLVVTEAGVPSGTFSTAEAALALGRNIFAAPGSIFSKYATGTNRLIAEGALSLSDEAALEAALAMEYGKLRSEQSSLTPAIPNRSPLLEALVAHPSRPDDLASQFGKTVLEVLTSLNAYELEGMVERLPDGRYAATEKLQLRGR